jgi:hypothetical protein
MGADQGNETAALQHICLQRTTPALDELQLLILKVADWYHHSAAFGELRQ